MTEEASIIPVPENVAARAHADSAKYRAMYERSLQEPDEFWREQSQSIDWIRQPSQISDATFAYPDVSIKWFEDGVLNVCANCVDRHLAERGDQTALIWERDEPGQSQRISYRELYGHVCRMANVLKSLGVAKGDRVVLYMPMIPEAAYAMLACARIGAVHSIVFGGFSPDALSNRIADSGAKLVVTANEGLRGGRSVPLKGNTDKALEGIDGVQVLVVPCTDADVPMRAGRDHAYADLGLRAGSDCPAEPMNAEDPLFILYTSGSTGKPKGVLHTTGATCSTPP